MKNNHKGFALIEGLLIILIIGALSGVGWYVYKNQSTETATDDYTYGENSTTETEKAEESKIPEGYKEYYNQDLGLTFYYPETWMMNEVSSGDSKIGRFLDMVSPERNQAYKERVASGKVIEGYPNTDLMVSYWSDLNNEFTRGGDWIGQKDSYASLEELLNDKNGPKQLIGKTTINDREAFEVSIGGFAISYGIMFETNKGIYEFNFINTYEKNDLTNEFQTIIDSVKIN